MAGFVNFIFWFLAVYFVLDVLSTIVLIGKRVTFTKGLAITMIVCRMIWVPCLVYAGIHGVNA